MKKPMDWRYLETTYMVFEEMVSNRKTIILLVTNRNSGDRLGLIQWNNRWRQYCFYPELDCIFSKGCLASLTNIIQKLMEERKICLTNEK